MNLLAATARDLADAVRSRDARIFQVAFLAAFLAFVLACRDFVPGPLHVFVLVAVALATQAACTRVLELKPAGPLSPLISALSLGLLLRTNDLGLAALAAFLAIASKFAIRVRGKHVFNPTNLGVLAVVALTDRAWVASSQWGSGVLLAFALAALGATVAGRAARLDVSLAFLGFHLGLKLLRVLWLGQRLAVFEHQALSGALILFTFFMISDPRSTPDARVGRVLFAGAVALLSHFLQFHLFWNDAPLWALLFVSPLTPLFDLAFRHARFEWRAGAPPMKPARTASQSSRLRRLLSGRRAAPAAVLGAVLLAPLAAPPAAGAFCGFYVARADASLYNQASRVVLVRDGDRTVLTMANDYQGDLLEFAIVVPVPTVLTREQVNVGDPAILDRLDAWSAPRLVEYHDDDPCQVVAYKAMRTEALADMVQEAGSSGLRARALGVTIEAAYTVGEYDIVILSATQSDGLETWLRESGYRLPKGAAAALAPYIRQGLKFFVAKVNLAEQARTGFTYLRPLQVAYESPRFMLPVRLGMLNAKGEQDLIVFTLTRRGRVETVNYRTVKFPTGVGIPPGVKDSFADVYRAAFATAHEREGRAVVFLEHAWDMAWCDPCAADPLTPDELRRAGVFWLDEPGAAPSGGGAQPVFLSRLHVRYDAAHFPEDLAFQETGDRESFQVTLVMRHPFRGSLECDAGQAYARQVRERREQEAQQLASLTGWDVAECRRRGGTADLPPIPTPVTPPGAAAAEPWWRRIFR